MGLRYAYHFELCERPELPEKIRSDVFLTLGWIQNEFGLERILIKLLPPIFQETQSNVLIELGSGSGDGLLKIASKSPRHVRFYATDKYPQVKCWEEKLSLFSNVHWVSRSVDFESFPNGMNPKLVHRSIVFLSSCFHHMPPLVARKFLERCVRSKSHVLIVEPVERSLRGFMVGLGAGLASFLAPLFVSGISLRRRLRMMLFHWVIPVIPFILAHDGIVSALRQRSPEEWRELLGGLGYTLETYENLGLFKNFHVVFLRSGQK